MYNINCPHCKKELSVNSSLQGLNVTCPLCSKEFIAPKMNTASKQAANQNYPAPPVQTAELEKPAEQTDTPKKAIKDYIWGRLYILLSRILALLVMLGAIITIALLCYLPFESRQNELNRTKGEKTLALIQQQKKFQNDYLNVMKLILTGNHAKAKFNFPEDIAVPPGFFNESLMTNEDVEESQRVLALYKQRIAKTSEIMQQYFADKYARIQRELNRGNAINLSWTKKGEAQKDSTLHLSFGQDANFYDDNDNNVLSEIERIHELLRRLQPGKNSNLRYQEELQQIKEGIDFINNRLNSKEKNITIGRTNRAYSGYSDQRITRKVGLDQNEVQKEYLENLVVRLNRLTSSTNNTHYRWMIAHEADKLGNALEAYRNRVADINAKFRKELKINIIISSIILVCAVWFAFIVLVFADFLRAHFDSAVTLKSINSKIKLFILLPLFAFLIGCGPDPKVALESNMPDLRNKIIDRMFAEKIAENPNATVYATSGKELVLLAGGIKKNASMFNNTIAVGTRFYSISHITVSSVSMNSSAITRISNAPYTHKAQLQATYQIKVRMTDLEKTPDGTPGMEFHTVVPDTVTHDRRDDWIKNLPNEIPNTQFNHAIAIHNISTNAPLLITENKIYEIFYNPKTGIWDLSRDAKLLSDTIIPPPVYSEQQHKSIMGQFQRTKFVLILPGADTPINLWVHSYDYDILDKTINRGLIKVNGVWTNRKTYEQTKYLQTKLQEWEKRERICLDDIEQLLLKPASECPQAENRAIAIKKASETLLEIFLKSPQGEPTENDRRRIEDAQKFLLTCHYIDAYERSRLLQKAQRELHSINKHFEQIQRQRAEQLAKEKAARKEKYARFKKMAISLKNAISKYNRNPNLKELRKALTQYPEFMKIQSYKNAVQSWMEIADISARKPSAILDLLEKRGSQKNQNLLTSAVFVKLPA